MRTPNSMARRLMTGRMPGIPWQTGHVWWFGGAPKAVAQPQNIFERVRSCAWTSRPITVSQTGLMTWCAPGTGASSGRRRGAPAAAS